MLDEELHVLQLGSCRRPIQGCTALGVRDMDAMRIFFQFSYERLG